MEALIVTVLLESDPTIGNMLISQTFPWTQAQKSFEVIIDVAAK